MKRVGRTFGIAAFVGFGLSGVLVGCGDDEPPQPGAFAPLHYDYLTKLRLNVGTIDIQDHAAPLGPDDISVRSPVTPAQALEQIGHDRLFAAGLQGSAEFVIDQASIVRGAGGGLYGQMAVHLEVLTATGQRAAYAEARVAQQHFPGSDDENQQTVLYGMTRKMADSMNVELEYQMKRSLGDFLAPAGVVPSAVSATPLGGDTGSSPHSAPFPLSAPFPPQSVPQSPPEAFPQTPSPFPAQSSAPLPQQSLSQPGAAGAMPPGAYPGATAAPPPDGGPYSGPSAGGPPDTAPGSDAPPQQMSPPPGYLQLPAGIGQ